MEKLDWVTLPAEIIKLITGNLISKYKKPLEYIIVNRNWFNASLSVFYQSVYIQEKSGEDDKDKERQKNLALDRLKSFCTTLKDSPYNVGQHVKEIDCYLMKEDLDLFGVIMNYCPNIEVLKLPQKSTRFVTML